MREVNASIITIGDELLIGQTIDTNSAFIAQQLNAIGIWVKRRVSIGDDKKEIVNALTREAEDCSIIIITGGLGPTADDITKPTLCAFFGTELVVNEEALRNVEEIFQKLGRTVTERNRKQAEVPASCIVLPNNRGTAPGMWFGKTMNGEKKVFVSLPGVPHEMRGLITRSVVPKLQEEFTIPAVIHRTLLTSGKGESEVADILNDFETALPTGIKLAYLPAYGMLRLRLTGKGTNKNEVEEQVEAQFNLLKQYVRPWLVVDEDISLVEAVYRMLLQQNKTVATAESCTGGFIAHQITALAGSSKVFNGSVVSYANAVKQQVLEVSADVLQQFGAVSEQTVTQMAEAVRMLMNTDYAIATSGIMGPDGGSDEKPVGTVWIAVANAVETRASKFHFRFDRQRNIQLTCNAALNMLRIMILKDASQPAENV